MQRRFSRRRLYLCSAPQAEVQTVHLWSSSHSPHYSASPPSPSAAGRREIYDSERRRRRQHTESGFTFSSPDKKACCLFSWEGALTGTWPTQHVFEKRKTDSMCNVARPPSVGEVLGDGDVCFVGSVVETSQERRCREMTKVTRNRTGGHV